ncbi:methoxymalonyl-ACP biosynthesis protein FkbH [Streptomyces sp. NPDC004732]|uniref:methoxymalonyl-ACP biosynthesis protein FkbH n=1 Tax=Streptomyces sp. NPDC004732 TaxID=3154290 RepID=UPI0033B942D7
MTTPPRPSPAQRLHALHTDGRLAARWPEVAPLLAEATDPGGRDSAEVLEELLACGRILAAVDPAEILARHPGTPLATITLTGHAALPDLGGPLAAELARHGMPLRLVTGERGAYLRDLGDPGGQLTHVRADLTLCLLDAGAVFDELGVPWSLEDAEPACARLAARLRALAAAHAQHGQGTLVLNTLPLLRHHTHQLTDERQRTQLSAIWRDLNAGLLRLAATHPRLAAVDLDPLIAETGPARDARTAARTGTPFTDALVAAYAREVGHLLRARRGPARTCLVLDGALWAGLLDEPTGGPGPGGAPHAALHSTLRQLAAQGVLLAVTGRGEQGPDRQLPPARPDLHPDGGEPAATEAGARPRDAGVREVARRLGIDMAGLVLADPCENACARVRDRLPAVAVIPLGADPALHVERLLQDGWFTAPLPAPPGPTGARRAPEGPEAPTGSPRPATPARPRPPRTTTSRPYEATLPTLRPVRPAPADG